MTPIAYMYTCRNLGQVALKWPGQPAPTGPGWIEVKQTGLYSADEVSEVVSNGEKCISEFAVYESALSSLLPGTYYMDPPDGGDVTLLEQMRRMAQDAARYRYLRDSLHNNRECDLAVSNEHGLIEDFAGVSPDEMNLDAAIDALMGVTP